MLQKHNAMKTRKLFAGAGFMMLMMMAGLGDSHPAALLVWLAVSVALLYIGRAFDFQTRKNR